MHSLSESELATKRGNASAIVDLRFVPITTLKMSTTTLNSATNKEVNIGNKNISLVCHLGISFQLHFLNITQLAFSISKTVA